MRFVKGKISEKIQQCSLLNSRDTQRGELWIRFSALRVWRIEDEIPCDQQVWLLIRQELNGSDTKFSFSNTKDSTPIETLTEWQSRRYFVERSLQDAKGLAGLDEYQVTGWRGWHHHTRQWCFWLCYFCFASNENLLPRLQCSP